MITLAVSVYNMEQYLSRCVDALLAQTCREFEILLIDDGSADDSGRLCDSYAQAHPGLVRVIHKENEGLSSARNAGIDAARGEWIVFPDPDDWTEPDYVEQFVRHCHGVDLVCTGHYVDTDAAAIPINPDSAPVTLSALQARRALLLSPLINAFAWCKLYRLDVIRENALRFRDDVGITEDLEFAYRYLGCCSSVRCVPSARTYHYYQREGAATRCGFTQRRLEGLRTYDRIIDDCGMSMPDLARAARNEICTEAVNLLWLYGNSGGEDPAVRDELLKRIRSNLPGYLIGSRSGTGRKIQALLAAVSPRIFTCLKNAVQK